MSSIVFDPLYIKSIERELGRKLDEDELEAIKFGETVCFQRFDKTWASFNVPYCNLDDLITAGESDCSFFEYAFNGGTLKKGVPRG